MTDNNPEIHITAPAEQPVDTLDYIVEPGSIEFVWTPMSPAGMALQLRLTTHDGDAYRFWLGGAAFNELMTKVAPVAALTSDDLTAIHRRLTEGQS